MTSQHFVQIKYIKFYYLALNLNKNILKWIFSLICNKKMTFGSVLHFKDKLKKLNIDIYLPLKKNITNKKNDSLNTFVLYERQYKRKILKKICEMVIYF